MLDAILLQKRLVESGIARPEQLRGCLDDEIVSLQRHFGLTWPSAYKEFLQAVGHKAGGFWQDVEFSADRLDWINTEARAILAELESVKLTLPPTAFVFSMR